MLYYDLLEGKEEEHELLILLLPTVRKIKENINILRVKIKHTVFFMDEETGTSSKVLKSLAFTSIVSPPSYVIGSGTRIYRERDIYIILSTISSLYLTFLAISRG